MSTQRSAQDAAEARRIANTIKSQLGIYGLGVVGASNIAYTKDGALTFLARLHFAGQSRVRRMRVEIALNASDYYDIRIVHPQRQSLIEDVPAEALVDTMYRLDAEGI